VNGKRREEKRKENDEKRREEKRKRWGDFNAKTGEAREWGKEKDGNKGEERKSLNKIVNREGKN
jgi:hypothetical protein